uniref:Uncharacterized protein n=1 Tax=viral metagenome TaxID=1070528 RepID=A0A6M3L9K5_9ZZZZ
MAKKVDEVDRYEAERYKVKCTKCGHIQFDKVTGHVCVKCNSPSVKVE